MSMDRVLVVDDEAGSRVVTAQRLVRRGYAVDACENGMTAIERLRTQDYDLIITDVQMPMLDGLGLLDAVQEIAPDTEVLVMTGFATIDVAIAAIKNGAYDFLQKPFTAEELVAKAARALEHKSLRASAAIQQISQAIFSTRDPKRLPGTIAELAVSVLEADRAELIAPAPLEKRAREPTLSRASIDFPLWSGTRILGVLSIERDEQRRPFRSSDLEKASVIAAQSVLALENVRLMEEAVAADRLSTVGRMASSVAHDINNPVTYLLANIEYARSRLEATDGLPLDLDELRQCLQDAELGAQQIRQIASDFSAIARDSVDRMELFDINESVRSALRIAGAELRRRGMVEVKLSDGLDVIGSAARMSQVFVNLLVNAVEALRDEGVGRIGVRTIRRDDRVIVEIEDDGKGIPSEHLSQLFEPFFGRGRGLANSLDIVRAHSGVIEVSSREGSGSRFSVILPGGRAQPKATSQAAT